MLGQRQPDACLQVQWGGAGLRQTWALGLVYPARGSTTVLLVLWCGGALALPRWERCAHMDALAVIYYTTLLRCSCNAQGTFLLLLLLRFCCRAG